MEKFRLLLALSISLLVLMIVPAPAKAETSCSVQGCDIKITIKLSFYDFRSQIGEQNMKNLAKKWEQEIESVWNGPNGHQTTGDCKCKVTFDAITNVVSSCPTPPTSHCIYISHWDGTTGSLPYYMNKTGHQVFVRAFMGFTTQSPSSGPAIDGWWSDVASQNANDAAHEAGHLMGLDDKEGNGIMTHTQGDKAKPTQENIDSVVKNVCGPNACPDRCCCGNGKVDKNKGEQCDPKATPVGCTGGQSCCPTCCKCYTGNHTHPAPQPPEMGLSDIYYQPFAGGVMKATFMLGANRMELKDPDVTKNTSYGKLVAGEEEIDGTELRISGYDKPEGFRLNKINYRLIADEEIYVRPGKGLREQLNEPEGMLSPFWDIVIVGEETKGLDVTATAIIAGSMQKAAVVQTAPIPSLGGVVMTGDSAEIGSTSDLLELDKTLGDVIEAITEADLDMLKGGQIIRPGQGKAVLRDEEINLHWGEGDVIFEWELEFEDGIDLDDLQGEDVFILGQPFVIVDTEEEGHSIKVEIMEEPTDGMLGEHEKTYMMGGRDYEVEVLSLAELPTGEGSVRFMVNGEETDELREGHRAALSDGSVLIVTGFIMPEEFPPEDFEEIKDSAVTFLDQALETQPLLQNLFGNERINVYIEDMETLFHIITSQGRVQTAEIGELPDQTLNFYTDTETIDLVSAGEIGIMDALEEGRMKYEGVGVVNALKIGLANTLFGIFTFFEDVPNQIVRMLG